MGSDTQGVSFNPPLVDLLWYGITVLHMGWKLVPVDPQQASRFVEVSVLIKEIPIQT